MAALAREEFIRQRTDDLPLHGARVLRLVHQQVLDAAVELVEHPGGIGPLPQQLARAGDEVLEVIGPAAALGLLEFRDDGAAEAQHGLRGGIAFEIAHAAQRVEQAGLVRPHEVVDPAMPLMRRLVGHPSCVISCLLGEQDIAQIEECDILPRRRPS